MDKFIATTPYQEHLLKGLQNATSKIRNEAAAVLIQCVVRVFVSKCRKRVALKAKALANQNAIWLTDRVVEETITLFSFSIVADLLPSRNEELLYQKKFNLALVDVTLDICGVQVDSIIKEVVKEVVMEFTADIMGSRKIKQTNPIVRAITGIIDDVLAEDIVVVVRLAINDIINEFLLSSHCGRGFDNIFSELFVDVGLSLVTEAWQEVDEDMCVHNIFEEVFLAMVIETSRSGLEEMIIENSEQYLQTQLNHVAASGRQVIGNQILLSHLLHLTSKNFHSILVQRMAKGAVNLNIINRLLSILRRSEYEVNNVRSNRCSKTLLKTAIEPTLKEVLIHNLKEISKDIVDDIDIMESAK